MLTLTLSTRLAVLDNPAVHLEHDLQRGVRGVHLEQEVDQRVLLLQVPLAPQHRRIARAARARPKRAALGLRRAQQLLRAPGELLLICPGFRMIVYVCWTLLRH